MTQSLFAILNLLLLITFQKFLCYIFKGIEKRFLIVITSNIMYQINWILSNEVGLCPNEETKK